MDKLPGGSAYDGFAYHIYLLKDFDSDPGGTTMSSSGGRRMSFRGASFRAPNGSFRSDAGSVRSTGIRSRSYRKNGSGSAGGGGMFASMRKV